MTAVLTRQWTVVCPLADLFPDRGVVALVNGAQVALFRTGANEVHAIGNRDPFSGAQVLARGIVGSRGDAPTVAAPMYKQVFDLRTGVCLDDATVTVLVFGARIRDSHVEVCCP
ncbi:MAG: nitrite reductase small subunit NirD [Micromonosporaceae bacterium]